MQNMEPVHPGDLDELLKAAFAAGAGVDFVSFLDGENLKRGNEYKKTPAPRSTFQRVEYALATLTTDKPAKPRYIKEVSSVPGSGTAHTTFLNEAATDDIDCAQFFLKLQEEGVSLDEARTYAKIGQALTPSVNWNEINRVIETFALSQQSN